MTGAMRSWLSERGLTATRIADKIGWSYQRMYRALSGRIPATEELHAMLCGVFGMTEREYERAINKKTEE